MLPRRIVAIGASTCEGAVDPVAGGFVSRLRTWLQTIDQHYYVYNLGISGDTSTGILKRMPVEIPPRKPELIILMGGSNDSIRINGKPNSTQTSPDVFKKNLQNIIKQARELAPHLLIIGINPVDEAKVTPLPWKTDYFYYLADVKQYAGIIKTVCEEEKVDYLDVWNEWMKDDFRQFLSPDGLHAGPKGHEKIFEMIKDYFLNKFS